MADITMCKGEGCNKREKCYRFTAKVGILQSYFCETPIDDNGECKHFYDNQYQSNK